MQVVTVVDMADNKVVVVDTVVETEVMVEVVVVSNSLAHRRTFLIVDLLTLTRGRILRWWRWIWWWRSATRRRRRWPLVNPVECDLLSDLARAYDTI